MIIDASQLVQPVDPPHFATLGRAEAECFRSRDEKGAVGPSLHTRERVFGSGRKCMGACGQGLGWLFEDLASRNEDACLPSSSQRNLS